MFFLLLFMSRRWATNTTFCHFCSGSTQWTKIIFGPPLNQISSGATSWVQRGERKLWELLCPLSLLDKSREKTFISITEMFIKNMKSKYENIIFSWILFELENSSSLLVKFDYARQVLKFKAVMSVCFNVSFWLIDLYLKKRSQISICFSCQTKQIFVAKLRL